MKVVARHRSTRLFLLNFIDSYYFRSQCRWDISKYGNALLSITRNAESAKYISLTDTDW